MMTKLKAFLIHIVISLTLFLTFLALVIWIWYPAFYAEVSGVWKALLTVAFVDVGLGPVMTLVLYKKGKKGLKFDLTMVAIFQISALIWGAYVLYTERPVLAVYDTRFFVCLNSSQADSAQADLALLKEKSNLLIPQVFLPPAKSAEEESTRNAQLKNIKGDLPQLGAYVFGKEFEPISSQNLPIILKTEQDLSKIAEMPKYQKLWQNFVKKHPDTEKEHAFITMGCGFQDYMAVLNRQTGVIVDAIPVSFMDTKEKRLLQK
jgi:hypothetical protein